jgi:ribonucleotide monophosphatase NagD (HAD superfamily)
MPLYLFILFSSFFQTSYTEEQKINHLLQYIATLKQAVFIRNGSEHSATEAAAHLEKKWKQAKSEVITAEDFIQKIASRSSMSGKPYLVSFGPNKTFSCEMLLQLELKKLQEGKVKLLR